MAGFLSAWIVTRFPPPFAPPSGPVRVLQPRIRVGRQHRGLRGVQLPHRAGGEVQKLPRAFAAHGQQPVRGMPGPRLSLATSCQGSKRWSSRFLGYLDFSPNHSYGVNPLGEDFGPGRLRLGHVGLRGHWLFWGGQAGGQMYLSWVKGRFAVCRWSFILQIGADIRRCLCGMLLSSDASLQVHRGNEGYEITPSSRCAARPQKWLPRVSVPWMNGRSRRICMQGAKAADSETGDSVTQ